jgi:hypothetical protein
MRYLHHLLLCHLRPLRPVQQQTHLPWQQQWQHPTAVAAHRLKAHLPGWRRGEPAAASLPELLLLRCPEGLLGGTPETPAWVPSLLPQLLLPGHQPPCLS